MNIIRPTDYKIPVNDKQAIKTLVIGMMQTVSSQWSTNTDERSRRFLLRLYTMLRINPCVNGIRLYTATKANIYLTPIGWVLPIIYT